MDLQIFQVDAFTTQLFAGNPAAVVPLAEWIDAALMQQIAAENNLSETAFFVPVGTVGNHWHIRWFTPDVEVPLCGHATLASAAVIRSEFSPSSWPITLDSASGPLSINVDGDEFVLDFPANEALSVDMPDGLQEALGAEAEECLSAGDCGPRPDAPVDHPPGPGRGHGLKRNRRQGASARGGSCSSTSFCQ